MKKFLIVAFCLALFASCAPGPHSAPPAPPVPPGAPAPPPAPPHP